MPLSMYHPRPDTIFVFLLFAHRTVVSQTHLFVLVSRHLQSASNLFVNRQPPRPVRSVSTQT
jgi:hypothetical protein